MNDNTINAVIEKKDGEISVPVFPVAGLLPFGITKIKNVYNTDEYSDFTCKDIYECEKAFWDTNPDKDKDKDEIAYWKEKLGNQQVRTPEDVIEKLINYAGFDDRILVMFNDEIVVRLRNEGVFDMSKVTFVSDSAYRLCRVHEECPAVRLIHVDKKNLLNSIEKELKNMDFDYMMSNPPYDNGIDLKILTNVLPHCDKACVVHPSTYLIQNKPSNKFVSFNEKFSHNIKQVELMWGNHVFGIELAVPVAIVQFDKSKNKANFHVEDADTKDKYEANGIDDVTWYGKKYLSYGLKEFFKKMEKNDSLYDHFANTDEKRTDFSVRVALIVGHTNTNQSGIRDDFFTFVSPETIKYNYVSKDYVFSKSEKEHTNEGKIFPMWSFATEDERTNFVIYLKSKFARFCLSYYKQSKNMYCGELKIVPWMDFSQRWDDKKLKEHFNISDELWKYIDEFIPDYYDDYKFDYDK